MGKKATADKDSAYFWSSASEYLNNELLLASGEISHLLSGENDQS